MIIEDYKDLPSTPVTCYDTEDIKTGNWRTLCPSIDREKCIKCYICWKFCPDMAIDVEEDEFPEIDLDYCKGCGICANECPKDAITMEREEEV
ncbi:MAG: 4Fe-4S binding protein [Methanomassiliicoccales archaeon]